MADGTTGVAYVVIVYSENSCEGDANSCKLVCVFNHEMHINTLECSFVVHHSTDENEHSAMSCIPYIKYVYVH